jgi:hypothetical protein
MYVLEMVIEDTLRHHHFLLPALEYQPEYIEAIVATYPSWIAMYEACLKHYCQYKHTKLSSCFSMTFDALGCDCRLIEPFDRVDDFMKGKRNFVMQNPQKSMQWGNS